MNMQSTKQFWSVALMVTCLKVLFIPTYHSTDFEVHRNWLAITHNLPLSKWYFEKTSDWTLDYPPLFAWFEFALSHVAKYFDPNMLKIQKEAFVSEKTILFQRMSVIATDLFYYYASFQWCEMITGMRRFRQGLTGDNWFTPGVLLSMLFLWNPGLLLVDHIHFQYNGMLSGILLLSLVRMCQQRELESAFWFAILLNMKHIYAYIAPAYFVYLLRNYCFDRKLNFKRKQFAMLASVVTAVFAMSFGPFVLARQLAQVLARLFPFKRGLSHAYWAPNFWAIYNMADKGLSLIGRAQVGNETQVKTSMTGGLVEDFKHETLFNITPIITLLFVLLSMVPAINLLWHRSHSSQSRIYFLRSVIICAFCSFMFGWHVHEKAVLLIILPLTPLAMLSEMDAKSFLLISTVGHFSLFPLLYQTAETPIKILLLLIYCVYIFKSLEMLHVSSRWTKVKNSNDDDKCRFTLPLMNKIETIYLLGLVLVQLFYSFGNFLPIIEKRFSFLPLMITSVYCSVGLIYGWTCFYLNTLMGN